jgi:hypothetical protein
LSHVARAEKRAAATATALVAMWQIERYRMALFIGDRRRSF